MYALGADAVQIGFLNSLNSAVRTVLAMPLGLVIDRSKKIKRLYIIGRFLHLPGNLIKAFAQNFTQYMGARVWEVSSFRISMPASSIISISAISNKDRVKGMVFSRTLASAAGLVAPIIAAFLITQIGGLDSADSYRPLFQIQFVVSIIVFIILATQLEEPEYTRRPRQKSVFKSTMGIFNEVPGLKWVLALSVARTFFMNLRMPFTALYIYDVKGATAWVIAYRSTISTAVALLLSVPIGHFADKIGRRRMGYMAQIVTASSALVTVLTPPGQTEWLLLASFLASLGMTMNIGWNAFIQEFIPLDIRGRWSGLSTTATALVGIPAPIIGGMIWAYNPDLLWWIMIGYYVLVSVPLRVLVSRKQKQTVAEEV